MQSNSYYSSVWSTKKGVSITARVMFAVISAEPSCLIIFWISIQSLEGSYLFIQDFKIYDQLTNTIHRLISIHRSVLEMETRPPTYIQPSRFLSYQHGRPGKFRQLNIIHVLVLGSLNYSTSTLRQKFAQFLDHGSAVPDRIFHFPPISIPISLPIKAHIVWRISSTTSIQLHHKRSSRITTEPRS